MILHMKFLIFETSGVDSFIALINEGNISCASLPPHAQNNFLLLRLEELFKMSHLSLKDIDFVAVGSGPGSFTGTRIGVLTAKTLSFARNIPLVNFCSLMRFAPEKPGSFAILMNAKSEGIYTLQGVNNEGSLSFHEPVIQKEPPFSSSRLLSPHPEKLPVNAELATLNLPHLASYLEQQYQKGRTCSPLTLEVSYLHTP